MTLLMSGAFAHPAAAQQAATPKTPSAAAAAARPALAPASPSTVQSPADRTAMSPMMHMTTHQIMMPMPGKMPMPVAATGSGAPP